MTVVDAVHGAKVAPDHVYVIQPNTSVAIADGVLSVTARPDDRRPHYPVDHFLRSLAAVQGPSAVGVILSGTGTDGTLGLCELKAAGGLTFAQNEESAQHAGMPNSAIASGAVDMVLPPDGIAAQLANLTQHPYLATPSGPATDQPGGKPEDFQRVIAALRTTSGVDFSQYRDTTIRRRTARRMLLRGFKSVHEYAEFVAHDRAEADALYRDVLINVTSFFRDPEMFDDLKRLVFPAIVNAQPDGRPVRVWVPGCSTGQEAYSIAMALLEFLDTTPVKRSIQIFATDLGHPAALEQARAGLYPANIEAEVSPDRLQRFFTKEEHGYRIQKSVRDLCVFARQNVTADPPFSRVDLLTCRNVLIYMSAGLQERLLPVFHFALNPGGFLVLGVAETIGAFTDIFEVVAQQHKIYRRKDAAGRLSPTFMTDDWLTGVTSTRAGSVNHPPADFQREADRLVQSRYAPPSVLINNEFEIQQFRGRTSTFLEAPGGSPTTNILRMAREGLFMDLRSALTEAKATNMPVVREHLRVVQGGDEVEFTLRVLPVTVPHAADCCFLVVFESADWPAWPPGAPVQQESGSIGRDSAWLRQELASTKQYLQSIVDQQDAATQELRAAHEEVLSSNEELQSTNEELETTKEELQSANEELTTVNEQSLSRNRELDALTDDLSNFITSADLPMVTVGRDLRIRRLTPAAQRAFNLLPSDVGRSLEHIKFALSVEHVGDIIEHVIASAQPFERDVADREGRWWVLRVHPFRTADARIDGATMVAIDIDLIRRGHEAIEARDTALAIVQAVRNPLVVLGTDCRVVSANDAFYALVGESPERTAGRYLWETGQGVWGGNLRRSLKAACTSSDRPLVNLEVDGMVHDLGRRLLVLNTRSILRADQPALVLLSVDDVTEARQAERLRVDAETLRLVDRRKDEFLGILAHELRNPLAPMRFALAVLKQPAEDQAALNLARQVLDRQVNHMVRIVDDLLDVSRITQGKVELRKERLELSNLVNAATEFCRPVLEAARHTLTISLPDEPVRLDADPVRLTQVLVNLLNNAVKFTPPGGHIWLIAETTADAPGEPPDQLRIRVRDTGIGIAREMQPRVFDLFVQGDRSLERTRAGLGVGLTLVRNLVGLHGGTIQVHSDGAGTGSEFIVSLPIDPHAQDAVEVPSASPHAPGGQALRILVVDDNDDGRELLAFLLGSEGHTVAKAIDGPSAIATAIKFKPDVAILDIGMPGMNGYAVAEALRSRPDTSGVVLVALSGLGQREDKERAVHSGFVRHFTKPVDLNALRGFLGGVDPARTSGSS